MREETYKTHSFYFDIGDITRLKVDAIVNAANAELRGGGGVDGAIHRAAGAELLKECKTLGGCEVGQAKITRGYKLDAKYVIHAVGPIYSGTEKDAELLSSCYEVALDLAKAHQLESIAFSAISTGVYGYPADEACKIALDTVSDWLLKNNYPIKVVFSCFSEKMYQEYKAIIDA